MTEPNDYPIVTLGGVDYNVPPIAFREVSKILPLLSSVHLTLTTNVLSEEALDALAKVIFYGIKRGLPDLTFDQFIDRPATVNDMMAAVMVVVQQAGIVQQKEPKQGEAAGATAP